MQKPILKMIEAWLFSPKVKLAMMSAFLVSIFLPLVSAQPVNTSNLTGILCGIKDAVMTVVFVVGLLLLVVGGSMYALAHIMPAQQKGALQGYGMGMIIGGVAGIILTLIAPFLINQLYGYYYGTTGTAASLNCGVNG